MTTPNTPQIAATGVLAHYAILARKNAHQAGAYARAIIEAGRLGIITPTQVAGFLAEVIGAGAVTATLLADLAVTADLAKRTGTLIAPLSLNLPDLYVSTIRLSVATVTAGVSDWTELDPDELEKVTARVERLANNLTLDVGQAVQEEALRKRDVVLWTRGTDGEPCASCRSLADGTVFPINKAMLVHPNCACVRLPILDPDVKAYDKVTEVPDVVNGEYRTLSTGHGQGRVEYTTLEPGLRVQRSAPRLSQKGLGNLDPRLNGALEAARRAKRGGKVVRPPSNVINLADYRKRKDNG